MQGLGIIHLETRFVKPIYCAKPHIKFVRICSENKENFNKLFLIVGFSKDKDISTLLNSLPKAETYYFTKSSNDRSIDPKILKTKFNWTLGI